MNFIIKPNKGAVTKKKLLGRGVGSGKGGTSGKGHKGQKARAGGGVRRGFEGGQMPIYRRLPKRGFKNNNRITFNEINISNLNEIFKDGDNVNFDSLLDAGLIRNKKLPVKILGNGELKVKNLKFTVNKISENAMKKIKDLNGSITIME